MLRIDIGKPAAAAVLKFCTSPACLQGQRTLRRDAEKTERQADLCAVRLREFPVILLCLSTRYTRTCRPALLAELKHVCSHQTGVVEAICQREHRGDHSKAQHRYIGCLVSLTGDGDAAVHQQSTGDPIRYDVSEPDEDRADELAHLQRRLVATGALTDTGGVLNRRR